MKHQFQSSCILGTQCYVIEFLLSFSDQVSQKVERTLACLINPSWWIRPGNHLKYDVLAKMVRNEDQTWSLEELARWKKELVKKGIYFKSSQNYYSYLRSIIIDVSGVWTRLRHVFDWCNQASMGKISKNPQRNVYSDFKSLPIQRMNLLFIEDLS